MVGMNLRDDDVDRLLAQAGHQLAQRIDVFDMKKGAPVELRGYAVGVLLVTGQDDQALQGVLGGNDDVGCHQLMLGGCGEVTFEQRRCERNIRLGLNRGWTLSGVRLVLIRNLRAVRYRIWRALYRIHPDSWRLAACAGITERVHARCRRQLLLCASMPLREASYLTMCVCYRVSYCESHVAFSLAVCVPAISPA